MRARRTKAGVVTAGAAALVAALAGAPAIAAKAPAVPAIAMPSSYGSAGADSAAPAAALDRFWTLFQDPALDALEAEAFAHGPDALAAAARVLEARATRAAQTARTLPSGAISGTASRERSTYIGAAPDSLSPAGITDTLSANFNVSWELDLFGRLAVARRVAAADAAAARFAIEGTRASLAADVADTLFEAQGLIIQADEARETARIQAALLEVARRRAAAGAAPPDDVDRVAGELARARARTDDLTAQVETARRRLLILIGRGLDPPQSLPLAGDPPPIPAIPVTVPAELLARRPDIREAEARLRSQIGAARLRHLAVFPTLTLLPGLGLSRTTSPGVSFIPPNTLIPQQQTASLGFWTLAAGLNAPTLDIPRLLYEARAEDARTRESAIAYDRTVRTAYGEARNALTDLAASQDAAGLLQDGEARARRAYDASSRRYGQGLDDLTATLTAEQNWRAVRSDLTAERVAALRDAVRAFKALGGGWDFTPASAPRATGRAAP